MDPAAISTLPLESRVAVWPVLAAVNEPDAAVNFPVAGSKISALFR